MYRNKLKYAEWIRKKTNTNPSHGPFHFRAPSRILYRAIRGMVPHKTPRGGSAMDRLKCFDGIPSPYDKMKRMVIPSALRVTRLKQGRKFCVLGRLSAEVGWKHGAAVAMLEEKRKARDKAYYDESKKAARAVTKAKAAASKKIGAAAGVLEAHGYA